MRTSPKQAWSRGANPCFGKSLRQRVTAHVASNLCRSSAYACEETRALPEQLVPLKPETSGILCPRQLASIAICNGFSRFYRCDLPQNCAKIITCHLTGRLARYFGLRQMLVVAFNWLCMQRSEVSNGPVPCCGNLDIVHFRFISKPLIGS